MKHFNSSQCIPIYFKTIQELSKFKPKLQVCKNLPSLWYYWGLFTLSKSYCKNPCEVVEYFGRSHKWIDHGVPGILSLNIFFVSNEIKVQEQYFIFSTEDLVGIVGGNLGLFIGFSFFEKIKQAITFMTNHLQN